VVFNGYSGSPINRIDRHDTTEISITGTLTYEITHKERQKLNKNKNKNKKNKSKQSSSRDLFPNIEEIWNNLIFILSEVCSLVSMNL
jgi:hypothetical protein